MYNADKERMDYADFYGDTFFALLGSWVRNDDFLGNRVARDNRFMIMGFWETRHLAGFNDPK
jgi:hypothetical protein